MEFPLTCTVKQLFRPFLLICCTLSPLHRWLLAGVDGQRASGLSAKRSFQTLPWGAVLRPVDLFYQAVSGYYTGSAIQKQRLRDRPLIFDSCYRTVRKP